MNKQINGETLLNFVKRIENLEQDAKQIAEDIKEVYSQAKAQGFEPKYIKQCIKLRAKDPEQLEEDDELLEMYRKALNI